MPFGRRNFMKNGSWLKRIFNALGMFFDPARDIVLILEQHAFPGLNLLGMEVVRELDQISYGIIESCKDAVGFLRECLCRVFRACWA